MKTEKYFAVTAEALSNFAEGWDERIVILLPLSKDNLTKISETAVRSRALGEFIEGDAISLKMGQRLDGVRFVASEWLESRFPDSKQTDTNCGTWYDVMSLTTAQIEEGEQALAHDPEFSQTVTFFSSTIVNGGLQLIIEGHGKYEGKPVISHAVAISDLMEK